MIDHSRLQAACFHVRDALLKMKTEAGHWNGELSTSALSTATAVMALHMVLNDRKPAGPTEHRTPNTEHRAPISQLRELVAGGLRWLAAHQNEDGGWSDTTKSFSNISTTMLAHAVFHATGATTEHPEIVERAEAYINRAGGVPALVARYGRDKTFSIPILSHCALAGLVDWKDVPALPFELACLPANFYKTVRLPVVSYALPALIAIGQVRHHFRKPWNPITRATRHLSRRRSLEVLERIQPENGGFLEAAPLTSFVTMSLAGMGLSGHIVARRGLEFLIDSVRPDGSWPIDTNLSTWVTTLSVIALGDDLPAEARPAIREWLLGQQYREVHPYTNADPGGWAWTDLPGGVPDADDTPGAVLALFELEKAESGERRAEGKASNTEHRNLEDGGWRMEDGNEEPRHPSPDTRHPSLENGGWWMEDGDEEHRHPSSETRNPTAVALSPEAKSATDAALGWLLDLQNRDGGWPTFCRGWGKLPFDRSSPDITAHVLRAMLRWLYSQPGRLLDEFQAVRQSGRKPSESRIARIFRAVENGLAYLTKSQRPDGSWLPLWFGCQHAPDDANPVYGTARVLMMYRDATEIANPGPLRGVEWLRENQNADGGWAGVKGAPSSVEETALAVDALLSPRVLEISRETRAAVRRGLAWLLDRVDNGTWTEPSPIGFYFAKLWYFERLYPIAFTVAALRRACSVDPKLLTE